MKLPTSLTFKGTEEAAELLAEAENFFFFVLESVAMMEPQAIRPGWLEEFDVSLSHLVIKHDVPQSSVIN